MELASQAYRQFLKKPFLSRNRGDVLRIANHKYCPRKHAIKKLLPIIDHQEKSCDMIIKCYRSYLRRESINRLIERRKLAKYNRKVKSSISIQGLARIILAKREAKLRREKKRVYTIAARKIQRFIRKLFSSFRYCVFRVISQKKWWKVKAGRVIAITFAYHCKKYLKTKAILLRQECEKQLELQMR
jgi:hypothetical protein